MAGEQRSHPQSLSAGEEAKVRASRRSRSVKALLAKLEHLVQEQTQIGTALIEHEAQAHPVRYLAPRQRERRQAPRRITVNLDANYWDGKCAASHIVRDVSASGAFVFADFKWPPGTIVRLILQLEGQVRSPAGNTAGPNEGSPLCAAWIWCSTLVFLDG